MNLRHLPRFVAAASLLILSHPLLMPPAAAQDSAVASADRQRQRPPNIVFILADDLGYGDLGSYGQKIIQTPNLDRMAAEGMRFTRHYAGSAVCAPARCVLMTGRHPGNAIVRDNRGMAPTRFVQGVPEVEGQFPLPADTVTLPKLLGGRGYVSGGFGKWGLGGPDTDGAPLRQGFDRWFGYNCQSVAHNYYPTYLWDNDRRTMLPNPPFSAHDTFGDDEDPDDPQAYARFRGDAYSADLIGQAALDFIRDQRDKPFFLYWPTTVPHVALQVPEEELEQYESRFDDPPYQGGRGYIPHYRPRAAYAAMITRLDREVGRAMDLIAEFGLDENTIFIFTSDNGPLHGRHDGLAGTDSLFFNSHGDLRDGKGSLYEGGVRVPGIVRWKGRVAPAAVTDYVSGFEDWLPTLVELAGGSDSLGELSVDGLSLAPLLLGGEQPERPFLYREFPGYGGSQAVWQGHWKAIRRGLNPRPRDRTDAPVKTELYDLDADPGESEDVADKHPDVVARLEELMAREHTPSRDFPFSVLDAE